MVKQRYPQKGQKKDRTKQSRRTDRLRPHAPIIISGGGSVDLSFDAGYEPDDLQNPTSHTATELRLSGVTVEVSGRPTHTCSHVTPNSIVIVQGRKDEQDEPIEVTGNPEGDGGIVIAFDHNEYKPNGTDDGRKKFRHAIRKVHSLTIKNPGTSTRHDCPAIPSNGKCKITVYDVH